MLASSFTTIKNALKISPFNTLDRNGLFMSCPKPLFQSEAKCEASLKQLM